MTISRPHAAEDLKLMRRAHFCAERAAEEEWRGIVKFNDVVERQRGGRAVLVAGTAAI